MYNLNAYSHSTQQMPKIAQHVSNATHSHGHTLDLVISRPTELTFSNIAFDNSVTSDHSMVICNVSVPKLSIPQKIIAFRQWKKVDLEECTAYSGSKCENQCTNDHDMVCGDDGRTYLNKCYLQVEYCE